MVGGKVVGWVGLAVGGTGQVVRSRSSLWRGTTVMLPNRNDIMVAYIQTQLSHTASVYIIYHAV